MNQINNAVILANILFNLLEIPEDAEDEKYEQWCEKVYSERFKI